MQEKQYKGRDRREYYRIRYPLSIRPSLNLQDKEYEVIDISAKGVKFLCKKAHEFDVGSKLQFEIIFHDDELLDLSGKILRVDENVAILYLTEEIPFNRIMLEQRYIVDNYPDYFHNINNIE